MNFTPPLRTIQRNCGLAGDSSSSISLKINGNQHHRPGYNAQHPKHTRRYFFGETVVTTVTHDPAISAQWISEVEGARDHWGHLLVGLDIEWRPSTYRNTQYPGATLQLCVGRRCLIYQLIHSLYTPSPLIDFLANKNCKFVGIGVKEDLERLQEDYDFGYDANVVDLRALAAEVYDNGELRRAGLKGLAKAVLGKEVEKPKNVTMSRWDTEWLSHHQIQYACVDACVSFEIGRILNV